jgi:regulator of RNase E activity RraA
MTDANTEHDTIDEDLLATLAGFDTPTICNALEIAAPERPRSTGYTRQTLIAADPTLPPMVGYARTATIRAVVGLSAEEKRRKSLEYYEYTAQGPGPTIVVVQDIDAQPGIAAWWGEVHTALHQGLGSLGAITNGAIRDLDDCAKGFQLLGGSIGPSHSYVHVADVGCEVEIFGMAVEHGSLIHADKHGAVLIPHEIAERLPAAIDTIVQREKVILEAIRAPDFNIDVLRKAVGESAEIH